MHAPLESSRPDQAPEQLADMWQTGVLKDHDAALASKPVDLGPIL